MIWSVYQRYSVRSLLFSENDLFHCELVTLNVSDIGTFHDLECVSETFSSFTSIQLFVTLNGTFR